jgi:hypothetical protein
VRDELVLRLLHAPTPAQLAEIQTQFADIVVRGSYRVAPPLPVESDEPDLAHLARLVFIFNRREHGRLRMLIDYLNDLPRSCSPSVR